MWQFSTVAIAVCGHFDHTSFISQWLILIKSYRGPVKDDNCRLYNQTAHTNMDQISATLTTLSHAIESVKFSKGQTYLSSSSLNVIPSTVLQDSYQDGKWEVVLPPRTKGCMPRLKNMCQQNAQWPPTWDVNLQLFQEHVTRFWLLVKSVYLHFAYIGH